METISIKELAAQQEELQAQRAELRARLAGVEDRLRRVLAVIDAVNALDAERTAPVEPSIAGSADVTPGPTQVEYRPSNIRVRSADMVAELINSAGRGLSRAEVQEQFFAAHPNLGWSTPVNALNTALNRAVSRGFVDRDGHTFYPKGFLARNTAAGEDAEGVTRS